MVSKNQLVIFVASLMILITGASLDDEGDASTQTVNCNERSGAAVPEEDRLRQVWKNYPCPNETPYFCQHASGMCYGHSQYCDYEWCQVRSCFEDTEQEVQLTQCKIQRPWNNASQLSNPECKYACFEKFDADTFLVTEEKESGSMDNTVCFEDTELGEQLKQCKTQRPWNNPSQLSNPECKYACFEKFGADTFLVTEEKESGSIIEAGLVTAGFVVCGIVFVAVVVVVVIAIIKFKNSDKRAWWTNCFGVTNRNEETYDGIPDDDENNQNRDISLNITRRNGEEERTRNRAGRGTDSN